MSEWRKDPIVDRWVIIATQRAKRPTNYKGSEKVKVTTECPFCAGNEMQTPSEIMAYRHPGTGKNMPGWWLRVIPNKYPAVTIEDQATLQESGVYQFMPGIGAHELVVETTEHAAELGALAAKQVEEIIWGWRERSLDLRQDKRFKYIQVFKNNGSTAGASLEHAHSQIIATPHVPNEVKAEITGMNNYSARHNNCALCDIIAQEHREGARLVAENDCFICFAPFASRFPFETWVVPKEHQSDFGATNVQQVQNLALIIRSVLRKMDLMINDMPYNMVLHTSPVNVTEDLHNYHWHLEILPRLNTMGGFELATGCYINPTPPELTAKFLRDTQESYPVTEIMDLEVPQYV